MKSQQELYRRSEELKTLYRTRREELKPYLRRWMNAVDAAPGSLKKVEAILGAEKRGEAYLDLAVELVTIAEDVLTHFTAVELDELARQGRLA